MEAVTASVVRSTLGPSRPLNHQARMAICTANGPDFVRVASNFQLSCRGSFISAPKGYWRVTTGSRRAFVVKASLSSSDSSGSTFKIAPLELESPVGQFLTQILASHPHLVPAAVEQQLEQLQTDREVEKEKEKEKEEPSAAGTDLVLYRRIAEVKANDRRKTLEEILYALVVQKFVDANVSLTPSITPDASGRVGSWASEEEKLERLHSPEAYEMIQNHLAIILGHRLGDARSVAQISKLRVGQVYAASVMYGYFLKRVDQRFQLEKTMKILPNVAHTEDYNIQQTVSDDVRPPMSSEASPQAVSHPEVSSLSAGGISTGGFGYGIKTSRLRSYVMSLDGESLHRYATLRSKEAVSIIEKHTEALFGKPEIVIAPQGTVDSSKDEQIKISFGDLKRLVLEAVTFGSFLWDVESYVDSRYQFVLN